MENLEVQADYNSLDLNFICKRIALLRQQKGIYLSNAFVKEVDNVYRALSLAISNTTKSTTKFTCVKPEKISDNMVDCCLRCMEEILQESIITSRQQQDQSKTRNELKDLAQDFYSLHSYISYSIDPQKLIDVVASC